MILQDTLRFPWMFVVFCRRTGSPKLRWGYRAERHVGTWQNISARLTGGFWGGFGSQPNLYPDPWGNDPI